jgi:hypothetical protein
MSSSRDTLGAETLSPSKPWPSCSMLGATPTMVRIAKRTYAARRPIGTLLRSAKHLNSAGVAAPLISTVTRFPPRSGDPGAFAEPVGGEQPVLEDA